MAEFTQELDIVALPPSFESKSDPKPDAPKSFKSRDFGDIDKTIDTGT